MSSYEFLNLRIKIILIILNCAIRGDFYTQKLFMKIVYVATTCVVKFTSLFNEYVKMF